jgi:Tol biopolymer transport system component
MRRAVFLVLALVAPLTMAACALNPPRIVAIVPNREGQDVPTNQVLTVSFDRPMNHASVESRFELSPRLNGCASSGSCGFSWSQNTLSYTHPQVNFEVLTRYTVSMHAGYADASGQQNTLEHVWHFTTEARPSLTAVDPADNATAVATDRNIVLSFSRPMQMDSLQASLQLSPDTPFLLRSKPGGDGSQFEIIPAALLQPNQTYTVSVDRPLDVHGNAISGRVQNRFKTGTTSLSRKIGYLVGQRAQPAFAVAIVDPHPDAFLQRSTPKIVFSLTDQAQLTDAILSFGWSPDGRQLAIVQAPRNAAEGPIAIVDLQSGDVTRPSIAGSNVYWSPDGDIFYLTNGVLRRYQPSTFQDAALTDPADGRITGALALSPDGKSVAYAAVDPGGVAHLWILNLDLHTRYRPIGLEDPADRPAWSPDGTKLAFRRVTAHGPELWVYDLSASGGNAYRRGGPLDVTGEAWLNDNSTLIAATGDGASGALYRVNIFSAGEAGGLARVTGGKDAPNGSAPNAPAYDRRVSFVGLVDDLPQIFVMNGDGSRPQQLTQWAADYPNTGLAPNWTPTG